jgi:hypothetical protein
MTVSLKDRVSLGAISALTLVALVCLLASAREARAGQSPQAPVPTQGEPGPTPPPAVTTQSGDDKLPKVSPGAPAWVYSLGMQQTFDSNVGDLQLTPQGDTIAAGDWHTGLEGSLSRAWVFPRSSLAVTGTGDQLFYRNTKSLNRFTYGLAAGGSHSLTSRLIWRGSESLTSMYAPDSAFLTTAGLVLPRVLTRINIASTGVSYQVTRKVQFNASVTGSSVIFPGSQLTNGTGITLQTSVSRQLTKNQTLGVSFGHTFSGGGDIQGVLGTWQRTFGRGLSLNAAFGVRPYSLHGVSGRQYAPGGLFGVTVKLSNSESLTASYERAVEQAFGFSGTHLAHRVNAGYIVSVGRRLGLEGSASYGLNTYPQLANFWLSGQVVTAAGRYLLGRQFSLGASYGQWVRRATASPTTSTYRTTFSLTYGGSWR